MVALVMVPPWRLGLLVRRRKPRRLRHEGAVIVPIMISDTRGLWHADMTRSAAERPRGANSATGVLGLELTRWRLASTDAGRNEALGFSRVGVSSNAGRYSLWRGIPLLGHGSEGRHLCMWASWTHVALLKMLEPCEVEPPPVEDGAPERLSVRTLLTRWRHQCEVDIPPVDCLMVAPLLVGPILSGKALTCHVVGTGQRVCRKRLLVRMAPTRGTLKRFKERDREFVAATEVQKDGATRARIVVIDWLAATEHVKNVNQALSIARAFARIFAKHRQCDISEVMGSTRRVHFDTLRRARILVDAVASLVWRQGWREIRDSSISIFLGAALALGERMDARLESRRHLLDARSKTLALLFQIRLFVGLRHTK